MPLWSGLSEPCGSATNCCQVQQLNFNLASSFDTTVDHLTSFGVYSVIHNIIRLEMTLYTNAGLCHNL